MIGKDTRLSGYMFESALEAGIVSMTRYPQVLVNFQVPRKLPIEELPSVRGTIDKVEKAMGVDGRVLVRYSGTESKARVMVEGTDEAVIRGYAEEIADSLRRALTC